MKTKLSYYEDTNNENDNELRSGISDNEKLALEYIEKSINEPIPPNQLALRTFYKNKIQSLMGAEYYISQEIKKIFEESYNKNVYNETDSAFVESLYGYLQNQNGGTRLRKRKHSRKTIKKQIYNKSK
jgi:hypothetical protein